MGQDELKVYDLVAKRFLAVFHPEAEFERTRVETTVAENVFRTSGRRLVEPGWKAVYGDEAEGERGEDDSGGDQLLPKLDQGEAVDTRSVEFDAQGDPAAAALHATPRCSGRWRRPARRSRTPSCARR